MAVKIFRGFTLVNELIEKLTVRINLKIILSVY